MLSTGIIAGDGSSGLAFSTPFYIERELVACAWRELIGKDVVYLSYEREAIVVRSRSLNDGDILAKVRSERVGTEHSLYATLSPGSTVAR